LTSQELINHSVDLKLLRDEGYEIEIFNAYLLIHNVPYVNNEKTVSFGILASPLELSGDTTVKPADHVGFWVGTHPCDSNGAPLSNLVNNPNANQPIKDGMVATHTFSQKPSPNGYDNYHQKMTFYISRLENYAKAINPSVTAKTFRTITLSEEESVFNYLDTSTSRAGIIQINNKLKQNKIAIIGLGGTGSYILDLVAKTEVGEIHLFDGDVFLQHNAFRSPGAPSIEVLSKQNTKVKHFEDIYSNMRRNIISHPYLINESNISKLDDMDTVFLCIDSGLARKNIGEYLLEKKVTFIDVGIGLLVRDESITGSMRVTTCTPSYDLAKERLHFSDTDNDEYSTNIQVADMNALNAAMAVIRWKKMCGFYHDIECEHHVVYGIATNAVTNEFTNGETFD